MELVLEHIDTFKVPPTASALPPRAGDGLLSDELALLYQPLLAPNRYQAHLWTAMRYRYSEGRAEHMDQTMRSARTNQG